MDKGHLDDVMNFIAVHIALSAENKPLPSHTIACGCRDFLSDRQLDVYLEGKAAHPCGASQEGKNALLAACSAALNIHSIAPHEEGLCRVNVGEIHAGVCANTIAPNAMMRIEYRGQKPRSPNTRASGSSIFWRALQRPTTSSITMWITERCPQAPATMP